MLYKKKLDTRFDTHGIKIGVQLWRSSRDSLHLLLQGAIYGVIAVEPAMSNSPLDCCIEFFESL